MRGSYETYADTDKNGKPRFYDVNYATKWMSQFRDARIKITFKVIAKEKSRPLMKYYRGYVVLEFQRILREAGYNYTPDQTHEFIKQFAPVMHRTVIAGNKTYTEYASLADEDFDNGIFLQYLEELKQFAAEQFGAYIKDPNEPDNYWKE